MARPARHPRVKQYAHASRVAQRAPIAGETLAELGTAAFEKPVYVAEKALARNINNLIDTMEEANVTAITIDVLRQIVNECDRTLNKARTS